MRMPRHAPAALCLSLLAFGSIAGCKPHPSAHSAGSAGDEHKSTATVSSTATTATTATRPSALLTGTNVVSISDFPEKQDALVSDLKAAHVEIVRSSITDLTGPNADARFGFVERLFAAGIKTNLILDPQYPADGPVRAHVQGFDEVYSGHLLSSANPSLSSTYFQAVLQKLEDKGVVLASIELGNELNSSSFNRDFPIPGHGQVYGLSDLENGDAEARQIAKSFLVYIQVIAALKEARDHSKLNRSTPVLTFGVAQPGDVGMIKGGRLDGVAGNDAIQFLRKHGVDKYVDAYGVHYYPPYTTKDHSAVIASKLSECGVGGSKPCWLTEWGIGTGPYSCPFDDSERVAIAAPIMKQYRDYFAQGRLVAALQFFWGPDPDDHPKSSSVYRCGGLAASGAESFTH